MNLPFFGFDQIGHKLGVNHLGGFEDTLEQTGAVVFFSDLFQVGSHLLANVTDAMATFTLHAAGCGEQLPAALGIAIQTQERLGIDHGS